MERSAVKRLEQRQLAKVEPLERPSLAGVDPKIARSLIRVYRKELKQRKEAQYIDAAKEVGLGSVAAVIYSGGQIAKATVEGVFDVIAAMPRSDPIVFGLEAITALAIVSWFNDSFPDVSRFLHVDTIPKFIKAKEDEIGKVLGRDDQGGTFGIATLDSRGYYLTAEFRWYTNGLSRDAAYAILTPTPDDAKRYVVVNRTFSSTGAVDTITPDSPGFIRDHTGKWAYIWLIDSGPSKGVETVLGYFPSYDEAQRASTEYNRLYNRNSFVRQV